MVGQQIIVSKKMGFAQETAVTEAYKTIVQSVGAAVPECRCGCQCVRWMPPVRD